MQIRCGSDARRSAIRGSADWNGIDYLEVRGITEKNSAYKNPLIIVHCFKAISGLEADNVLFSGGVRVKEIAAEWAYTASEVIASHQDKVSSEELEILNMIESPSNALVIRSNSRGDFSTYKLSLVESADTPGTPPAGFDIILSQVEFSFKVECPSEFDCACIEASSSLQQKLAEPIIDYMAKDYASFRKLMLDRLSLIMPDWKERNPADIGIMLVEVLAYVGDHLSYYQDAVATEAYLGTAKRRISAARHARLLDYSVNEGRNSRAWICFEVAVPNLILPKGTQLLTKTNDEKTTTDTVIKVEDLQEELIKGAEVFESMYEATLYKSKNKMSFYTWSETDCWLPAGSTSATVNGSDLDTIDIFVWENVPGSDTEKLTGYLASNFGLEWLDTAVVEKDPDTVITISSGNKKKLTITLQGDRTTLAIEGKDLYVFQVEEEDPDHKRLVKSSSLRVGDVLVFAEEMLLSPPSVGLPNLNHRHAVRMTSVAAGTDELTGVDVLEIEWDQKDALPFSLCLEKDGKPGSAIYGNVVLADHGYTKKTEDISATTTSNPFEERKFKDRVVAGKYYPRLDEKPLTCCGPDFEITAGKGGPAASAIDYDSNKITPAINLLDANSVSWKPARDLFSGDEFAPIFVVETESDGTVYLRFSEQNRDAWARQINEGTFKGFTATYRIGNGSKGNVGAESITRAAGAIAPADITKIFNPMPARGGEDPETIESIRLHAPQAFRKQERAVTASDYEEVLMRHTGIQKAAAEKRWTGSWYTMFVAIDRKGGMDVDKEFEAEIVGFLEKYRLAGYDVEIQSPIYVPLKISIEVCLNDGYFWGEVKEELLKVFSSKEREDGGGGGSSISKGFFHPDNFTFGQTLYLSRVYEATLAVAGVSSVIINEFHRWGKKARGELDDGYIKAGAMEILRLDNDPNFAENGMIAFSFYGEGGGGDGA